MTSKTLKLTLEVDYDIFAKDDHDVEKIIEQLKANLAFLVSHAVDNGMITGESDAVIDDYRHQTFDVQEADQDAIADYLTQRVENGDLNPEDLIVQAVRYGMQEPAEFAAEMNERIEIMQEELSGANDRPAP